MLQLGYNTNGLAHHRPAEAVELLAEAGFTGVALTPDVGPLDPLRPDPTAVRDLRDRVERLGLGVAIETGARFVLDPRHKHRPTLLEGDAADRARRQGFLGGCIELAGALGAEVVSVWAGAAPPGAPPGTLDDDPQHPLGPRLAAELAATLERARRAGVTLAFEPEPGMLVERVDGYRNLLQLLGSDGDALGLTLDTGHCVVNGELPVGGIVRAVADRLRHVHLADCPAGKHVHLPLGKGDLDLQDALGALWTLGFGGMVAVECSRDSHRGPDAVRDAFKVISRALTGIR